MINIKSNDAHRKDTFSNDGKIEVPASILQLKAVSREMNFTTKEMIGDFKLVQTIMLFGKPLEGKEICYEVYMIVTGKVYMLRLCVRPTAEC